MSEINLEQQLRPCCGSSDSRRGRGAPGVPRLDSRRDAPLASFKATHRGTTIRSSNQIARSDMSAVRRQSRFSCPSPPGARHSDRGAVRRRKIIVNIATSADGYVARLDGNLDWLTGRPAPKGFYGLPEFSRSIDAKILGRKTFDLSLKMGASFSTNDMHYVF